MERQVCEQNKVGEITWEPKCVSAWSANWLIADAGPAEYLKPEPEPSSGEEMDNVGQWRKKEGQTDKKTERKSQKNLRQECQLFDGKISAANLAKSSKGRKRGNWSWKKEEVRVGCAQRACKESHFRAPQYRGIRGEVKQGEQGQNTEVGALASRGTTHLQSKAIGH